MKFPLERRCGCIREIIEVRSDETDKWKLKGEKRGNGF